MSTANPQHERRRVLRHNLSAEVLRARKIESNRQSARRPAAKAKQRARDNERHKKLHAEKLAIVERVKSVPCMDCGGAFDPVCMDFDHRPGTNKLAPVSQMLTGVRWTVEALVAEIVKCDVVCACCHRLRTHRERRHRDICVPSEPAPQLELLGDVR